jgi:glycosyltransferase involved in cell wall biosynthesis
MRILYHHRTQGEEPESVHIASIVAALEQRGHVVDLVGPTPVAHGGEMPKRNFLGRIKAWLPRPVLEVAQLVYNLRSFLQLWSALRIRRPSFIYERYALYNFAGVLAARWFNVPIVLEVNTLYAQAWDKYYGLRFKRLARWIERRTFQAADRIITVTDVQRRMLEAEGLDPSRVTVSHNAVNPLEMRREAFDVDALRRSFALRGVVAGFVGTMNRWQGVHGFAEVIRDVCAAGADVSFLFVGEGEGRAALVAEIDRLGVSDRVVFVGRRPHAEMPRYLAAMDIGLLLDSNAYGSPMKVFEYWAMGLAVIAPRVEPVVEILRDADTGLLIDPGSAAEMTQAILRLTGDADLRRHLAERGKQHVFAHHTWLGNADRVLEAYAACRAPAQIISGHS